MIGSVTSAGYAYATQQSIAYAYLPVQQATAGTKVTLVYFDLHYTGQVVADPVDPSRRTRMRA